MSNNSLKIINPNQSIEDRIFYDYIQVSKVIENPNESSIEDTLSLGLSHIKNINEDNEAELLQKKEIIKNMVLIIKKIYNFRCWENKKDGGRRSPLGLQHVKNHYKIPFHWEKIPSIVQCKELMSILKKTNSEMRERFKLLGKGSKLGKFVTTIPDMSCSRTVIIPKKRGKTEDPLRMRKIAAQGFQSEQLGEEQIKNMHPIQGGRKKKTRKVNKLSLSDYRKILKFYKMKIPKSASKIRKEGNKIIAQKFCSCIKKVRKKFKKEGIAIGICTKSVITRKNIKRGSFNCKTKTRIDLYKGGSKKSKKNKTRKKRGGILFPFFVRDSDTSNINLVLANKPRKKSMYGEPHPWRKFFVDPRDNDDLDEIDSIPDGLSFSFPFFSGGHKKTRKKRGGQSGKKLTLQEFNERIKKRTEQLRTSPITASIGINPLPKRIRQFTTSPINAPNQGENKDKNGGHPRPLISHEDEEYEGGNKSKKIKDIVKIFKQYPDIFPRGYFRYLPATLEKHHKKGTLIYKNGVVLTYTKYKKTVNKYKKYKIKPGDVKLNQLVNKEQGNGEAKKIFLKFMEKHKDSNLLLDVLASNKKAIRFYRKNGFKKIDETKFGDKLKGIVMLKRSKNNRTRKKKN